MDRRYKKRIDRYWLKMERKAEEALSGIYVNQWFDLWHTHPDWNGKGNTKTENRRRASELTYQILKQAEKVTENRGASIQCFAIIKENTMESSVYIHSENPNGSDYPFAYDGVAWDTSHSDLENLVNLETHQLGTLQGEDELSLFIRKRA